MEKTEGTGERVGGYRVVRRLATGSTSDVLLAKASAAQGPERFVVLKVLLAKYERDSEVRALFAREAGAYARLSHPSIVQLYDFFADGDQLTLVLEYIDGPPLSLLRGMLKAVAHPFDDATSLHLAASVFDALAAAHAAVDDAGEAAPVIHRDVNPSNVLVSWEGEVKLADFGIARVTGVNNQSGAGLVKGTYGYMAPEQVKGEPITPRADVYAGAVILWELLTRRRAFIRGALPESEVLRELAQPRIVSIDILRPDLHASVRGAIKRALEPRADKRTITAEEMVSTLRAVAPEGEGRRQLGNALALVRHEPKASPTSMPPPLLNPTDDQQTGKIFPRGLSPPRPAPAPRGVPRKTAPYGALPPSDTPRPPVLAAVRPRSLEKEMPAATLSPEEVALVMGQGSTALPWPPSSPDEVGPSSVPGLASILEPSSKESASARAAGRVAEKLRLGTPLEGVSPGRPLSEAIDDILSNVPSNIPPDIFPKTDPPQEAARSAPPHELGQLPPAPPTLEPLRRDLGATAQSPMGPRPLPSSFPQSSRTLAMYERVDVINPTPAEVAAAERLTERPQPHLMHATTAPMQAVAPSSLNPATARMAAFAAPPEGPGAVPRPDRGSSPSVTLALAPAASAPRMAPPPLPPPPLPEGAPPFRPSPGPMPHAPSRGSIALTPASRPPREPIPYPASAPAQRRGSPIVAILVLVLIAIAAGGAGIVGYLRWQKSRAVVIAPSLPTAPSTVAPVASAPLVAASTASSAPSASSASAAALAGGPATPAASTSASAVAAASAAPAEDVPSGMGRVRTTGSAPGRRIFVDERTVGQTPDAVVVKCGARKIRVGSAGAMQIVDVPCGGEITVGDR